MEAEFGKYLEERFPSADKGTSGVIRAVYIVHVITLISSAHACPAPRMLLLCARVQKIGYYMLQGLASFASKLT